MRKPGLQALLLPGLVAGCLGSGLASAGELAPASPQADGNLRELNCAEGGLVPLDRGVLINNMWNRKSAGSGPWWQCLQSRHREGRTEYGWRWRWPGRDGLYAYPQWLLGQSPWANRASNDPRFPRTIRSVRALVVDLAVESVHTGKKNLATEFWFTSRPPSASGPDTRDIQAELMIWTEASPGLVNASEKRLATVEIDGRTWWVYAKHGWGDISNGSAHTWSLISYVAAQGSSQARFDARKFFADAVSRGLLREDQVVWGVEVGNEIVSGTGSTWLRRLEVTVQ